MARKIKSGLIQCSLPMTEGQGTISEIVEAMYQKHVPFIVWVSDGAYEELHIDQACLRASLDAHRNHDYLFHTVLGLFTDRKSDTYRKDLDVFQACRR